MNFTTEQILSTIDKKDVFKLISKNCFTLGNTVSELSTKMRFHNYMVNLIDKNFGYDMKEDRKITVNNKVYNYLDFNRYVLKYLLNEFVQYSLLETFKTQGEHGIGSLDSYALTDKGNNWIKAQKNLEV